MQTTLRRLIPLIALVLTATAAKAQDKDKPRPRSSWTSDRREFVEGDIITVMVDESTLASAKKGQTGSDNQSRANDLSITPPGGTATSMAVNMGTNKQASSDQQGTATRNLSFRGEMTVRVMKVNPNGVLEIKGDRTVDVDKNKQLLTLTGSIRPQDISASNTVTSARIADAQMVYTLSGDIGGTRGGIIGRLVSVFWP